MFQGTQCGYKILVSKLKVRDQVDTGEDGGIILKSVLNKKDVMV
jgi:hypothetical protein